MRRAILERPVWAPVPSDPAHPCPYRPAAFRIRGSCTRLEAPTQVTGKGQWASHSWGRPLRDFDRVIKGCGER